MSQYGTIYRLNWNTVPSVISESVIIPAQVMQVSIYDTDDLIPDADDPIIIQLQADANPLVIKVINNDEDKFSPIRAKQAIIQFKSNLNQLQDSTTFADSGDNRWLVECTADGTMVFTGFLMLTDIQQDHLPDPNAVVLTASDHLGLLRDIAWSKDDLTNPTGKIRIAECIALALKKTGLRLDIAVINNLRHGSGQMTLSTTFTASNNRITPAAGTSFFFYEGMAITITGTVSNNIPVTIGTVTETYAEVIEGVLTNEGPVDATFTDTTSVGHFYHLIYLDAKTFEAEIGLSEDCYSVLEKILGEDCFLTQWLGKWYIMRIDEYDNFNDIYPATFDADGGFTSFDAATNFDKSIGASETRRLANADALRRYDRPHRYVKETAKYVYPAEIVCNIDFSRGTGAQPTGAASETIDQTPDCWEFLREDVAFIDIDSPPFPGSYGWLRKEYIYGVQDARYFVTKTAGGFRHYFKSSAIEVGKGDRIEIGYNFRLATVESVGAFYTAHVRIEGDDGFLYDWNYDSSTSISFWHRKTATDPIFDDMFYFNWASGVTTDWASINNAASTAAPVSGKMYIRLVNQSIYEQHFEGLSVNIKPYINGSYRLFTGQFDQVLRLNAGSFTYNAKRDREVFIFDSPRKEFKGAMFFFNALTFTLTQKWYTGNTFALGYPPDQTYMHTYGHIQSYAVWNQYRNANRIFSTSVLGMGSMWVDLLDKIMLTDSNPNTDNRYFLLISMEQNWKTGLWSGVFVEDYRTDIGHDYDDTHSFGYTSK